MENYLKIITSSIIPALYQFGSCQLYFSKKCEEKKRSGVYLRTIQHNFIFIRQKKKRLFSALTLGVAQAWHGYLRLSSPGTTSPFIKTNPKNRTSCLCVLFSLNNSCGFQRDPNSQLCFSSPCVTPLQTVRSKRRN